MSKVDLAIDELTALKECLFTLGILSVETFQASLHRRHFAAVIQAHPCTGMASMLDVLTKHGAGSHVAKYMCMKDAVALSSTCSSIVGPIHAALRYASVNQPVYFCGGTDGNQCLNHVECFDPSIGRWESLPSMQVARSEAVCAMLMGRVCVCGGAIYDSASNQSYSQSAEYYNPYRAEWVLLPPMSTARRAPICGVINDELYVCGGIEGFGDDPRYLNSVEKLNLLNETWETAPPMLTGRANAACAVLSNCLYVVGGHHTRSLRAAEFFDSTVNQWKALPKMKEARENAISCGFRGNLYICGGRVPYDAFTTNYFESGFRELSTVELFSRVNNQWGSLPPMCQPCYNDMGAVGAVFSGSIYIFGASSDTEQDLTYRAMVFDTEFGQWKDLPPLPRKHLRARTCANPGFIYFCGGFCTDGSSADMWSDPASVVSNYVARFNVKLHEWEALPPISTPISFCQLHESV